MDKIEWKDASKERPQEGQAVLVASYEPARPTEIICNLCEYSDGRFWHLLKYTGREPKTDVAVVFCDFRYEVQHPRAWCDAKEMFQEAGKFFANDFKKED